MSLRSEFQTLYAQLRKLNDALVALRVTVVEDRPLAGGPAILLDAFGDAAEDMLGWLEESRRSAAPLAEAPSDRAFDVNRARQSLVFCQDQFNRVAARFAFDLISYERVSELMRLGRERRGEWRAWAASVKESLDGCQQQMYDVNHALFRCWQEIAERVGMTSVSVQATNIGQQVTVPTNKEQLLEEVT